MSNFNQEMTRWTSPQNPAFYALHKNAIGIYQTVAVIVQVLWLIFSTQPLATLLAVQVPFLSEWSIALSVVALAFFHYLIHELVRYVLFNWLDDDPNTNSSFGAIASLVILLGGLLALDVMGITSFIRDETKYTTLHTQNETQGSAAAQKRLEIFNADLAVINAAFNGELDAVNAQYAAKIRKVERRKTYDDFDIRKRSNDVSAIKAERDAAIGVKKTELATAQKQLVAEKNATLANIDNKHNGTRNKIDTADAENESKAHSYGWIISIFCLITLLFCTYQSTVLRVLSGQKPVSRFTIADATGSTTTKLFDVLTDAWQRQSHRFLVFFHGVLTTGTQELDEIDGAFILKKKGAQAATSVQGGNNNDLLGGNNGGGGGIKPPPMPPAPGQPLGGRGVQTKFVQRMFNDLPSGVQDSIAMDIGNALLGDNYDLNKSINALSDINPIISVGEDYTQFKTCPKTDKDIEQIMRAYHRDILTVYPTSATSTPPETIYQSVIPVITDITPVITDATEKGEIDNQKLIDAFRTNIQDLNSECRNYETNNGKPDTIVERIADKLVKLYRFSKEHEAIIPENVFKNFSKAYDRAYSIVKQSKERKEGSES